MSRERRSERMRSRTASAGAGEGKITKTVPIVDDRPVARYSMEKIAKALGVERTRRLE